MGAIAIDLANITLSGERTLRRIAGLSGSAATTTPRRWIVVSSVSVVEAHVSNVLRELVGQSEVDATRFGAALVAHVREDMSKTWDARMTWLARAFDVRLAGDPPFQRFRTVVDLRNALLHGDGELTDLQTRTVQKALALRKELAQVLHVECFGRRVVLGDDSHELARKVAREFVAALDRAVLALYPEFDR